MLSNRQSKPSASSVETFTKNIDLNDKNDYVIIQDLLGQVLQPGASDQKKRELLDNKMLSYKNKTFNAYVYVGNFWIQRPANAHADLKDASKALVQKSDLISKDDQGNDCIQLKFRERGKGEYSDALINGQAELSKGSRRTKERKIGEVILAVKKWRELYTIGEKNANATYDQLSLEDAAKKVNISKKSLDDYFL